MTRTDRLWRWQERKQGPVMRALNATPGVLRDAEASGLQLRMRTGLLAVSVSPLEQLSAQGEIYYIH